MDKATGKTSEIVDFLDSKKTLIVTDILRENVYRGARNISGVTILPMAQVNAYEILKADKVFIMQEAIEKPKKAKKL
jgi:ribosomal protein L4